jgi:hypothetical protein
VGVGVETLGFGETTGSAFAVGTVLISGFF